MDTGPSSTIWWENRATPFYQISPERTVANLLTYLFRTLPTSYPTADYLDATTIVKSKRPETMHLAMVVPSWRPNAMICECEIGDLGGQVNGNGLLIFMPQTCLYGLSTEMFDERGDQLGGWGEDYFHCALVSNTFQENKGVDALKPTPHMYIEALVERRRQIEANFNNDFESFIIQSGGPGVIAANTDDGNPRLTYTFRINRDKDAIGATSGYSRELLLMRPLDSDGESSHVFSLNGPDAPSVPLISLNLRTGSYTGIRVREEPIEDTITRVMASSSSSISHAGMITISGDQHRYRHWAIVLPVIRQQQDDDSVSPMVDYGKSIMTTIMTVLGKPLRIAQEQQKMSDADFQSLQTKIMKCFFIAETGVDDSNKQVQEGLGYYTIRKTETSMELLPASPSYLGNSTTTTTTTNSSLGTTRRGKLRSIIIILHIQRLLSLLVANQNGNGALSNDHTIMFMQTFGNVLSQMNTPLPKSLQTHYKRMPKWPDENSTNTLSMPLSSKEALLVDKKTNERDFPQLVNQAEKRVEDLTRQAVAATAEQQRVSFFEYKREQTRMERENAKLKSILKQMYKPPPPSVVVSGK